MAAIVHEHKIDYESEKCSDPELYNRALEMLKQIFGERADLPYDNYFVYETVPDVCTFPPRATLRVDVSKLVSLEDKVFYPCARASLYFDKEDRPVMHIYKKFKILYTPEEPFRTELLNVLKEAVKDRFSIDSSRDVVEVHTWLRGDEVFTEAKTRLLELAQAVLHVIQQCPWLVACYEYMQLLSRLMLEKLDQDEVKVLMEEPDIDILTEIDLDRLSKSAYIALRMT